MHVVVIDKRDEIALTCRRNYVVHLDVFGSAARALDFGPERSDIDFSVECGLYGEDSFLTLKDEFEQMLQRPINLLDCRALRASRNYLRRARILADA